MSKFFTYPSALLLAWAGPALASEEMPALFPASEAEEVAATGSGLPAPLSSARFAPLARKSPFTLSTSVEENAEFAKDLILAGYLRIDGQDFVIIAKRGGPERLMVGTKPSPSAQGLLLDRVERDPLGDPTKLRAFIRKGGESAVLNYESAAPPSAGSSPAAASAPPAAGSAPGGVPNPLFQPPPAAAPAAEAGPANPPKVRAERKDNIGPATKK